MEVSTIAGVPNEVGNEDGKSLESRFNYPIGICLDNQGDILVADNGNNSIRRISRDGTVSTVHEKNGAETLNCPCFIQVDQSGNIFLTDSHNDVIRCISPEGRVSTFAGKLHTRGDEDGTIEEAAFTCPYGIIMEDDENILFSHCHETFKIKRISKDHRVSTIISHPENNQYNFSLDRKDGTLIILKDRSLLRVSMDGSILHQRNDERFRGLRCGSFLSNGDFVFTDYEANVVWGLKRNGELNIIAGMYDNSGHRDGDALEAQFNGPSGITIDLEGNIFVCNKRSHCIQKIQRIKWTRSNHSRFPSSTRFEIKTVMTLWRMRGCLLNVIPRDVIFYLFDFLFTIF